MVLLATAFALSYVSWGLLLSLLPPFYPTEAEKKGATPSQYGFVFGICNIAAFFFAPIFGKFGDKIGPKRLFIIGAFTNAIFGLAFGTLQFVEDTTLYITLSYVLRFINGVSDAASWGSSLSILIKLFPDKVATLMSYTEMCTGLGYMLGPAVGSFLYEIGGFVLPFEIMGGLCLLAAFGVFFSIPDFPEDNSNGGGDSLTSKSNDLKKRMGLTSVLKHPSIFMPLLDNLICYSGFGMIESMLEPHMKTTISASQMQVGVAFLISGGVYMVANPPIGKVCDLMTYPVILSMLGNVILSVSFIFLGPVPFIDITPSLTSVYVMMALAGMGAALTMVSTYGRAHSAAIRLGYKDNICTYLLVSSTWSSSFFLGSFLGPTVAGFTVEHFGFRATTFGFVVVYALVLLMDLFELMITIWQRRK